MNDNKLKKSAVGRGVASSLALSISALISSTAMAADLQKLSRLETFKKADSSQRIVVEQQSMVELFVEPTDGKSPFGLFVNASSYNKFVQKEVLRRDMQKLSGEEMQEKSNLNGLAWAVKSSDVSKLNQLPNVKRVSFIIEAEAGLENSVPWIGAPSVWATTGNGDDDGTDAGEPVSIAIIDSGIDYFHETFGGSGDPADFANNNPDIVEPGTFPTTKVIGGIDFAGADQDNYVLDADPNGVGSFHGTHVAGIAANIGNDKVAPGVAPGADLYAVKVFADNGGGTSVSHLGIQWSEDPNQDGDTSDRADVLNLSLGSDFGRPDDIGSRAADQASEGGSIVVIAAGNSGDVPYIHGGPAVSAQSISVANSLAGGLVQGINTVSANASANGTFFASEGAHSNGILDGGSIEGELVAAGNLDGCAPLTNAAEIDGNVALIIRGGCAFDDKYANAEAAGATGLVVYNDGADATRVAPFTMGGVDASRAIAGVMVSSTDGAAFKAALDLGQSVSALVNVDTKIQSDPALDETLAGSTSRGPGLDNSFKPDLAAPGTAILSTNVGSGDSGRFAGGTSMASPHVAGVAALLRQKWPELPSSAIKAMLQNSTTPAYRDGIAGGSDPYPLTLQGVGRVQADVANELTSYASPGGVSFGRVNDKWNSHSSEAITLTNLSDQARVYTVSHVPNQTMSGVNVRSYQNRVYVPAGGERTFKIAMDFNPRNAPFDASANSQSEVDGWFVLEDQSSNETLRVGYMAVVDPAAGGRAFNSYNSVGFYNAGGSNTYAEGFTLAGIANGEGDKSHDIDAFGYRTGVNLFGGAAIDFAFTSKGAWSAHGPLAILLDIDSDEDGVFETTIQVADFAGGNAPFDGNVENVIFPGGYNLGPTDVDFNDRVLIARYLIDRNGLAPDVGFLDAGDTDFNYSLRILNVFTGEDSVLSGTVNLEQEVTVETNSFVLPRDGSFNSALTSDQGGQMLWLYQQNQAAEQAQIINVRAPRRF
ncbi:MAG: S8 family serine peptidase [Acidiferrobacterales bacterium]|nr:S8 family serine peptidase [Acidiferrobacterales bacterium]